MKSFAQSSVVSWLLLVGSATFLAPLSLGQSETTPQRNPNASEPPCPTISVSCPNDIKEGELQISTATVAGGDSRIIPTYTWTIHGGTIIQGQGTRAINFKVRGDSYTVSVQIGGLNSGCSTSASCSLIICRPPPIVKSDSYGLLPIKEEKARLEKFATALRNQPGAQGYILFYGGRTGSKGEAKAIAEPAKAYLLMDDDIHPDRIVMVDGGFRETLTIDLWVVPAGAISPKPTPTVDISEVKTVDPPPSKAAKRP